MNPCDPGADTKNVRAFLHLKMGIPKAIVERASKGNICKAIKRCGKSTGTPMPSMGYDKVGNHLIYYHNPTGINLTGKDYKDLLIGKPTMKTLKSLTSKVGLVHLNNASREELKGAIIKRLKAVKAPEPLMVPIPRRSRDAVELSPAIQNAERVLNNNAPNRAELIDAANKILNSPPSAEIANKINENVNANSSVPTNSSVPDDVRKFNRVLAPETALQTQVQNPGVTENQLRKSLGAVVSAVKRNAPSNTGQRNASSNAARRNVRVEEIKASRNVGIAKIQAEREARASAAKSREPVKPLNQLRLQRVQNMQLRNATSQGNMGKPSSNVPKDAKQVAENAQRVAESAQTVSEDAENKAANRPTDKNVEAATVAAAEATKRSQEAILAIKQMIGKSTETNNVALITALKLSNANETKRAELANKFKNINKNTINKVISKYESTGAKFRRTFSSSSTGNAKKNTSTHNTAVKELRNKMNARATDDNAAVLERAVADTNGKYSNILSRINKNKFNPVVKKVHGTGRLFKTNGHKEYIAKLNATNTNTKKVNSSTNVPPATVTANANANANANATNTNTNATNTNAAPAANAAAAPVVAATVTELNRIQARIKALDKNDKTEYNIINAAITKLSSEENKKTAKAELIKKNIELNTPTDPKREVSQNNPNSQYNGIMNRVRGLSGTPLKN